MSKEVILMESIPGLGDLGDVVKVADGYARNYLLPRGMAEPVTEAARRRLEKKRKEEDVRRAQQRTEAEALAARVAGASCSIAVKTGAEGRLFGSVGSADIAEALKKQGIAVDRHAIRLEEPIRELGVFNVPVKLTADIATEIKVWVVEE
jgi:large subunit ribosomal protein L9